MWTFPNFVIKVFFEISYLFYHLTELSKKVSLVSSFLSSRRLSIPYTTFGFCCCIFESLFFLMIFVRFGGVSSLRNGRSSKDASPNQRKERELRVLVFNSFYIDGADNLNDRPLPNSPYFFRTSVPPWTASVRVLTFNLSLHNYFYKLSISYIMLTYQNRNEIEWDIRLKINKPNYADVMGRYEGVCEGGNEVRVWLYRFSAAKNPLALRQLVLKSPMLESSSQTSVFLPSQQNQLIPAAKQRLKHSSRKEILVLTFISHVFMAFKVRNVNFSKFPSLYEAYKKKFRKYYHCRLTIS